MNEQIALDPVGRPGGPARHPEIGKEFDRAARWRLGERWDAPREESFRRPPPLELRSAQIGADRHPFGGHLMPEKLPA